MTAVAGDFYDFLEIDAHRVGVLVADVTGHGVPAALIASMVKVALAAQREHADSPAAVLAGMNETLWGRLAGQYVTAAYLFIDGGSRVIRYGAAGHPPMLRSARRDGRVDELEQNGLLLGFLDRTGYTELEQPLDAGDRLSPLHRRPDRGGQCRRRSLRAREAQAGFRRCGRTGIACRGRPPVDRLSTPGPGNRRPTISRSCSSIGRAGSEPPSDSVMPLAPGRRPSARYFDDVNGNE